MSKTKKSTNPKRINTNSASSSVSLSKTKRIYQKSKKKIKNDTTVVNENVDNNTDDDTENDQSILSMLYNKFLSIFI
jgi:hypothetical protein